MNIKLYEITIREIAKNYIDNEEEGVVGFDGKLNIRPKYQREFIYKEDKRDAVIDTINKNFPLNVMYWAKNNDDTYEVLDGQQRTISFCQYVNNDFSLNNKYFHNLTQVEQDRILNYKCMIYICEGNDLEKLEWFKTINIAGEQLTAQELRNAVYTGTWLSDAKLKFSKTQCAAYLLGNKYINGSPIRQEYLETAIKWVSNGDIEQYMAVHQHDPNANSLWTYFKNVIDWVELTFPTYRKEMKGIDWSYLYNNYKDKTLNIVALENKIKNLMIDDDVTNKKGIYRYVLTGDERSLNMRACTPSMSRAAYERQNGICSKCGKHFLFEEMEADHITPWSKGGTTSVNNCQMLCKKCNRIKSNI